MEQALAKLRALADPTRLRLLALLRESELSVSELTRILGQSQPRVSRHLKLLCEAGLLERHQEGSWVFHRVPRAPSARHAPVPRGGADIAGLASGGAAQRGGGARDASAAQATPLLDSVFALVSDDDMQLTRDRARLAELRSEREARAGEFFTRNAASWDQLRARNVDERLVEAALLARLPTEGTRGARAGKRPVECLLDLGTGTGRILELYAPYIDSGMGVDSSREMLAVARSKLETQALRHCQVRLGDIYHLSISPGFADLVTIHHVLHFLEHPRRAIEEASVALRPGGRLVIVDYARHAVEELRTALHHRRLGFESRELLGWCASAGLDNPVVEEIGTGTGGGQLSVIVLSADKPGLTLVDRTKEVA